MKKEINKLSGMTVFCVVFFLAAEHNHKKLNETIHVTKNDKHKLS